VDVALVQTILTLDYLHHGGFFALAICVGALAGTATNFVLSRRYVFKRDGRPAHEQFASFALISLSTLMLRLVAAHGLLALLTLPAFAALSLLPIDAAPERLAYLGAVGLVTIYSFLAHKHVSFAGGFLRVFQSRAVVP
jgi:putative flippase GtrA